MHQRRPNVNTMANGRLQSHQVVSRLVHSTEGVSLLRPHYSMKKELAVYARCWCRAPLPQGSYFSRCSTLYGDYGRFQVNSCNGDQSHPLFDTCSSASSCLKKRVIWANLSCRDGVDGACRHPVSCCSKRDLQPWLSFIHKQSARRRRAY